MRLIAIIDDDEAVRSALQVALTEEGYAAILIAERGDVLGQLDAAKPDLVLLDMVLGGWSDGLVLAAAMRAEPLLADVPIIVMSAAPEVLRRYSSALMYLRCQLLAKPFDLDDLLGLITGVLASDQN
jgi:DNA-binding response OmpR family regulator